MTISENKRQKQKNKEVKTCKQLLKALMADLISTSDVTKVESGDGQVRIGCVGKIEDNSIKYYIEENLS